MTTVQLFPDEPRRPWDDVPLSERQLLQTWYHRLRAYDWYYAGVSAHALRTMLEGIFQSLPDKVQAHVWRSCKKARNAKQADGRFFELILHRLFVSLGFDVTWEPKLENGLTPDFLIEGSDGSFYVEALVTGSRDFDMGSNERHVWKMLVDLMRQPGFLNGRFGLLITWTGTLERSLGKAFLKQQVIPT